MAKIMVMNGSTSYNCFLINLKKIFFCLGRRVIILRFSKLEPHLVFAISHYIRGYISELLISLI